MAINKFYILLCGFEIIPKSISTRNIGSKFIMSEPISSYLLDTDEGLVLIDTGINNDIILDSALRYQYFTSTGWDPPPVVLQEHELVKQLNSIGVNPPDVKHVILTHMHADHTGSINIFTNATVTVQKDEYIYAMQENPPSAWFKIDYVSPSIKWNLIDGDCDFMSDIKILRTRGHTPGHQSIKIKLRESGTKIIVGDAGDLSENFEFEIIPGESVDDEAALQSIRRLKQIAHHECGELIIGHDPNQIQKLKLSPEWYS